MDGLQPIVTSKRKPVCPREGCREARSARVRAEIEAHNLRIDLLELEAGRDCLLQTAGDLATRLAAAHRARDAALGDAASLRADLRTALASLRSADKFVTVERARAKGLMMMAEQEWQRAEALETKLEAMREERDHAREALDTAAEALGQGAEENEQLRAMVAMLARQFAEAQEEAQRQGAAAFQARTLAKQLQSDPFHFVPAEGITLPNGDIVLRIPGPRWRDAGATRQAEIHAAHIKTLYRLGAKRPPEPVPQSFPGSVQRMTVLGGAQGPVFPVQGH